MRWGAAALAAASVLGIIVLAGGLLLVADGLFARSHERRAQASLTAARVELQAGRTGTALADLQRAAREADQASRLTDGPLWHLGGHLPVAGDTLHEVAALARIVADVSHQSLPTLATAVRALDRGELRRPDGSLDIARLQAVAPAAINADAALAHARTQLQALPDSHLIASVAHARATVVDDVTRLSSTIHGAALVSRLAPAMLGGQGRRSYLVALLNPAEARGSGGIPGSWAVVHADEGRLTLERVGSDDDLGPSPRNPATVPAVDLGPAYHQLWGSYGGDGRWLDATIGTDFPQAARVLQAVFTRATGEHVDGVVALDPVALDELLTPLGGVNLTTGEYLPPGKVAPFTMQELYSRYPSFGLDAQRKEVLTGLTTMAFARLTQSTSSLAPLLAAVGQATGERRIKLWSDRPAEQELLAPLPVAAAMPTAPGPFAALSVSNATGGKLEYYLDRSLDYTAAGCQGDTRTATVTARLTDTAPTDLPASVTFRQPEVPRGAAPGDDRLLVTVALAVGAVPRQVTLDGIPLPRSDYGVSVDHAHSAVQTYVELPRGRPVTLTVTDTEPTRGPVQPSLVQPLVRPQTGREDVASCS